MKHEHEGRTEVVVDRIQKEPWHLSKSVPLSLIMAIFIQTIIVAGAWFTHKSDFENFKEATRAQLVTFSTTLDDRYRKSQAQSDFALRDERIAALKESLLHMTVSLSQLDKSLDDKFDKLTDLIRDERRKTHPDDARLKGS